MKRLFKVTKEFSTQLADFAVGEVLYMTEQTRRVLYFKSLDDKKECGVLVEANMEGYLEEIGNEG